MRGITAKKGGSSLTARGERVWQVQYRPVEFLVQTKGRIVMRLLFVGILACCLLANDWCSPRSIADEQQSVSEHAASDMPDVHSYSVQLVEFQYKPTDEAKRTSAQIAEVFDELSSSGQIKVIEIMRLSALENFESMVNCGRMVDVVTGVMQAGTGRPASKVTQTQSVGTMVKLTANQAGDKTLLTLAYEASRVEGNGGENGRPETSQVRFQTTLLLEDGKPKLVGGSSYGETNYLMVTITH